MNVTVVAATPLNLTVVPPLTKLVPVIVTIVPTGPRIGVNELIVVAATCSVIAP